MVPARGRDTNHVLRASRPDRLREALALPSGTAGARRKEDRSIAPNGRSRERRAYGRLDWRCAPEGRMQQSKCIGAARLLACPSACAQLTRSAIDRSSGQRTYGRGIRYLMGLLAGERCSTGDRLDRSQHYQAYTETN